MIPTNPYNIPSAGRSYGSSVTGWLESPVPIGFRELAEGSFGLNWEHSLGKGLYELLYQRENEVQRRIKENPRLSEILSPEQIAKEYPHTENPIRTPRSRAEMEIIQADDMKRARMMRSLSGQYTSAIPSLVPTLGGGLAGSFLEVLPIVFGVGSMGLISQLSGARRLATAAALAKGSIARRGSAATVLALDGFVGGLGYSLTNMPVQRKLDRPYHWGRVVEESLYSAGFGTALGAALPSTGNLHAPFHKSFGDTGVFLSNMALLKKVLESKDGLKRFMADDTGRISLSGLAEFLSGRNTPIRDDVLDSITDIKVNDLNASGISVDGSVIRSSLEGMFQQKFTTPKRFRNMSVNLKGVQKIFGRKLTDPKRFYKSETLQNRSKFRRYPRYKLGGVPVVQYRNLYSANPRNTKGTISGTGKQKFVTFTDTPEASVLEEMNVRVEGFPRDFMNEVEVFEVSVPTGSGGRAVRMFDLDSDTLTKDIQKLADRMSVKEAGRLKLVDFRIPYKHMSELNQARVRSAIQSIRELDGTVSRTDRGASVVEMKSSSLDKVRGVSHKYLTYKVATDNVINKEDVKHFMDILDGKAPESVPPAVNRMMSEYYKDFDVSRGDSFYEKYIRRVHPTEINHITVLDKSSGIKAPYGPDLMFDMESNFLSLNENVYKDVVSAIESAGVKAPKSKILYSLDEVIKGPLQGNVDRVGLFTESLRKKGYVFPSEVSLFHPAGKWFLLNDRVLSPLSTKKNETVFTAVMGDHFEKFKGLNIYKSVKDLELDIAPNRMLTEEIKILEGMLQRDGVYPDIDPVTRTGTFQHADLGKVRSYINEVLPRLRNMGIRNVNYRTPSGVSTIAVSSDVPVGQYMSIPVEKFRDSYMELTLRKEVEEGKPATKVETEGDEKRKATLAYLKTITGAGPMMAFNRLVNELRTQVPTKSKATGSVDILTRMQDEYRNVTDDINGNIPTSQTYQDAFRRRLELEEDARKMHQTMSYVREGGLEFELDFPVKFSKEGGLVAADQLGKKTKHSLLNLVRLNKGEELNNLFNYMPDMPYQTLGGDNLQSTYSHKKRVFTTALLRGVETSGGKRLMALFRDGHLDVQIFEIEAYIKANTDRSQGVHGKVIEDAKEKLNVSEDAFKVYNVLREVSEGSQRSVLEAGYQRRPRSSYIGTVAYDGHVVIRTPEEEFVSDVLRYAQILDDEGHPLLDQELEGSARAIYKSFQEGAGRLPPMDSSVRDVRGILDRPRTLDFKSGQAKYDFLQKYGQGRGANIGAEESWKDMFNFRTKSNVLSGSLSSIDSDARIASVVGWFGNRPFLTLDLAHNAMVEKYWKAIGEMGKTDTRAGASLLSGLRRSKDHLERVLQTFIVGDPASLSRMADVRRLVMGAVGSNLLGLAGVTAGFSDFAISAAQMSKMSGRNFFSVAGDLFKNRLAHLSPETQREVARRANLILSADNRDYLQRIGDSGVPGMASHLNNMVMWANGVPYITDTGLSSNATYLAMELADSFKFPFKEQTEVFKSLAETYGVDEGMWDFVRNLPDISQKYDGVDMVFQDRIWTALSEEVSNNKITIGRAESIYKSFDTLFNGMASERSIPVPGIYEKEYFNIGKNNPDGIVRNLSAAMSQFKSMAVTAFRSILDSGSMKRLGVKGDLFHAQGAKTLAAMTVAGGMIVLTQDIMKGRTPRDVNSPEFWMEAMMRGGAMGLWGDMVLGDHNKTISGLAGFFLGPAITGPFYNSSQVLWHSMLLQFPESVDHFWRILQQITPHITPLHQLVLNTMFLNSIGALGGNKRSQAAVKRNMEDIGSQYFADN